jgi:hypothetical protein
MKKMVDVQGQERVIDYKKLKKIFSNNTDVMEQVMHGLIVTAHQKAPDLERFYKESRWAELKDTVLFIQSAYQHVATDILKKSIIKLSDLVEREEYSSELGNEIANMKVMSRNMISDIEYYLEN